MSGEKPNVTTEILKAVMTSLCQLAEEERRKTEPYKDMFEASEYGIRGVLNKLNDDVERLVLTAYQVIEDRTGKKLDDDFYLFLKGINLFWGDMKNEICDREGMCCSVDKVRELVKNYALNSLRTR
jgi:hypothetical protein